MPEVTRPALVAFLSGTIPIAAVSSAYFLNVFAGDSLEPRFVCWPYVDGCVSISRAARSGPGLHLFRALMLPCAVLLFLSWDHVRVWLRQMGACSAKRAWTLFALGAVGAFFLVFYVTWLGTDGEVYRWLRRYGVTFYFGGTALAQLLLVWTLWPLRRVLADGRLSRPIALITVLVSIQWMLGVSSVLKRLLLDDPDLIDRIENIIEWWYALPMALVFVIVSIVFSRTGFHAFFRVGSRSRK